MYDECIHTPSDTNAVWCKYIHIVNTMHTNICIYTQVCTHLEYTTPQQGHKELSHSHHHICVASLFKMRLQASAVYLRPGTSQFTC